MAYHETSKGYYLYKPEIVSELKSKNQWNGLVRKQIAEKQGVMENGEQAWLNPNAIIRNAMELNPEHFAAAIASKFPGVCLNGGHVVFSNDPFYQAFYNQSHVLAGKNLKLVCGSLGLGLKDPWYEYGGRNYDSVEDFQQSKGKSYRDAHCWLEDADGNIYDVVSPFWCLLMEYNAPTNRLGALIDHKTEPVVLEAQKRRDCRIDLGLHFIPAPIEVQTKIIQEYVQDYKAILQITNLEYLKPSVDSFDSHN